MISLTRNNKFYNVIYYSVMHDITRIDRLLLLKVKGRTVHARLPEPQRLVQPVLLHPQLTQLINELLDRWCAHTVLEASSYRFLLLGREANDLVNDARQLVEHVASQVLLQPGRWELRIGRDGTVER